MGERLAADQYAVNSEDGFFFGVAAIDSAPIKAEIDAGRPLIILMQKRLGGSDHWVVGYGYQDYTYPVGHANAGETYSGYIVHFGWDMRSSIWVNESWCNAYISLDIKHSHNYNIDTGNIVRNEKRELRCEECGHRTVDSLYRTNSTGNEIVEIKYPLSGNLTIPSTIDSVNITGIGAGAFAGCTSLTTITIPESVATIGTNAFSDCTNISAINFNASNCQDFTAVDHIFSNLGANTGGITVSFGNYVRKIPAYLFYGVDKIQAISIPNQVSNIGDYAFSGCNQLTQVILPSSLTAFGQGVFFDCSNLTSLTISDNEVYSTENGTLYNADKSKLIYVPEKCNLATVNLATGEIAPYAYYQNQISVYVTLMGATKIGEYAFNGCKELMFVTAPSVIQVDDYAFANSAKFNMFYAGNNLMHIGVGAIDNTQLKNNSTGFLVFGKVLYEYNGNAEILTKEAFPVNATKISSYAFFDNENIREVYLPLGIDFLEQYAFYQCPNLVKIQYENLQLPYIQQNAFKDLHASFRFYCARNLINQMNHDEAWAEYETLSIPIVTSVFFKDSNVTQLYYYGETNLPPDAEKEGYHFYGWYEQTGVSSDGTPELSENPISNENWMRTESSLTYVGKYIEMKSFDLIFKNGQEIVGTAVITTIDSYRFSKSGVTINGNNMAFSGAVKMNYYCYNGIYASNIVNGADESICIFDGWWWNQKEYTYGNEWGNQFTDNAIILQAKWIPVDYICTLNFNGGTGSISTITYHYFSNEALPIPTRSGYAFHSWQNNGIQYTSLGGFVGDITLNAIWNEYLTVVCVSEEKSLKSFTYVKIAGEEIVLPELDFEGYKVILWGNYNAGAPYTVSKNETLKAVWAEKTLDQCYNGSTGYYEIWTLTQLKSIGTKITTHPIYNGPHIFGNYLLKKDLTLNAGYYISYPFMGIFDGNQKTIYGLNLNENWVHTGLFVQNLGEIKNVTISGFQIRGNYASAGNPNYAGIIVGNNSGTIYNCKVKSGTINIDNKYVTVGGISGGNSGSINNCTVDATVNIVGKGDLGGIAGRNSNVIGQCVCSAKITYTWDEINKNVGGIVGYNTNVVSGEIKNCTFTGNIYWTCEIRDKNILPSIGLICGWNERGTLSGNQFAGANCHIDCESYYVLGIMIWDQSGRVMKKENGQTGWGEY